jgi:hypothetical protein
MLLKYGIYRRETMKKLLAALIVITMVLLSGQAYTKDVLYKENASTILGEYEDKVILLDFHFNSERYVL